MTTTPATRRRTASRGRPRDALRHWPASLQIPIPDPEPAPELPDLSALTEPPSGS